MTDEAWITLSLTISAIFLGLLIVYGLHHESWGMLDRIATVPK